MARKAVIAIVLLVIAPRLLVQAPEPIRFTLRFPAPQTHYVADELDYAEALTYFGDDRNDENQFSEDPLRDRPQPFPSAQQLRDEVELNDRRRPGTGRFDLACRRIFRAGRLTDGVSFGSAGDREPVIRSEVAVPEEPLRTLNHLLARGERSRETQHERQRGDGSGRVADPVVARLVVNGKAKAVNVKRDRQIFYDTNWSRRSDLNR